MHTHNRIYLEKKIIIIICFSIVCCTMYLFTILYFQAASCYCLFKSNWKAAPLPPQNYIIKKILLKNFSRILSHSNYFFPYPFMLLITRVLWRIQWRHRYRHQLSQRVQTMWPQEQGESVSLHQSSTESPPSLKPPESGPTPTPELSTNPESPPVKRSEVVEEFWLQSAEIRKSLGLTPLSRECDPKHTAAQTSNVRESFYTSVAYIPSCNTNSSNQMLRNCDSSTQTPSQSTSLPEPSHTMDSDAGEETIGRCSVIHRLSITVEGCVMGDKQDLDLNSTSLEMKAF